MNLIAKATRKTTMSPHLDFTPAPTDHDLPVLAVQEEPAFKPEWESLHAVGEQPALILGAERRTSGHR
jgi:hypothetical protein